MIAALLLAAALFTPAECADLAKLRAGWAAVNAAMADGPNLPDAKAAMDAMIVCGDGPGTAPPRALRADIASREGDDALVVKLLSPMPTAQGPLGAQMAWLLLRTYARQGDQAAFALQRSRMLAAQDYALGDPAGPLKGRLVERFEVGPLKVSAYAAPLQHETARRLFQFVILADTPTAEPEAILFTDDSRQTGMAKSVNAPAPVYIDRYGCNFHSTVRTLRGEPSYAQAKAAVVEELTAHADLGMGAMPPPPSQGAGCRWPVVASPGLGG